MKNLLRSSFIIFILILVHKNVNGQDKMILRFRTDTLLVKVLEVGTDEIKYRLWPVDNSMPIMVERKDKIRRVIFENGTVMKFSVDEFSDPTNYAEQRKAVVKIDPFSILWGLTSVSYEQSMKPGKSWEVGMGFIGLGTDLSSNYDVGTEKNAGLLLRAGYKFIHVPDFYLKGMRYAHILKGGYIRPEIATSLYTTTVNHSYYNYNISKYYDHDDKYRTFALAFMLNFGKQYVFDDIFAVDVFVGGGIGGGSETAVDVGKTIGTPPSGGSGYYGYGSYYDNNQYSEMSRFGFITSTNGKIMYAFQCGLKIGMLIGKKNEKKINRIFLDR